MQVVQVSFIKCLQNALCVNWFYFCLKNCDYFSLKTKYLCVGFNLRLKRNMYVYWMGILGFVRDVKWFKYIGANGYLRYLSVSDYCP